MKVMYRYKCRKCGGEILTADQDTGKDFLLENLPLIPCKHCKTRYYQGIMAPTEIIDIGAMNESEILDKPES